MPTVHWSGRQECLPYIGGVAGRNAYRTLGGECLSALVENTNFVANFSNSNFVTKCMIAIAIAIVIGIESPVFKLFSIPIAMP